MNDKVPLIESRVENVSALDYARGVDEHIDSAKVVDRLRYEPVHLGRLGDVPEMYPYRTFRAPRIIPK